MTTLSSREILGVLREFGIHTKKDRFLYLILYKLYFSLNYCRRLEQINGLIRLVDTYLRKFDKLDICYINSTEI